MMSIEELYDLFTQSGIVCTDTRDIKLGSMFFALKGENFNGNKFAPTALSQGAKFAIIDEPEYETSNHTILVASVLETLQELAAFHRNQLSIPVVAVTGSNGKTTTKELLFSVLSKKYKVACTKGNLNNHIGVPLTLLSITDAHELALIEMGDNHPNEVAFLCEIAKPNFGFVTNVGKDHLEGFGSFEKNISAKKEVFDYLALNKGTAFVDQADELVFDMVGHVANQVTYGLENSFSNITFLRADPVVVFQDEMNNEVVTQLFGGFNFNNFKLAYCIGKYFEVDLSDISTALMQYLPDNNRSQVFVTAKNTLIMDAYNANPSSVLEAVKSLASMNTGKLKMVLLGDMFELGRYSEAEHQEMTEVVTNFCFDQSIFVGEHYAKTTHKRNVFSTKEEAEVYIKKIAPEGAIILLKGSRGMRMETFKDIL
jgi:UDP-N-acetylmuramoyl-tripeptide--D-alanyl-D-alanine ligase